MSEAPPRPSATYRLQFTADFGFAAARALVPYLDRLGISHVYASPILAARSGSTHGYDIVDPTRLNPALGTEDDLAALVHALHERGMGLIVDVVPNHLAASTENPWWTDVLTWGTASPYAHVFAIDWRGTRRKVLIPVLGEPYGEALESGTLQARLDRDGLFIDYHGLRFPVNPGTYHLVFDPGCVATDAAPEVAARVTVIAAASRALESAPPDSADTNARTTETRAMTDALWDLYSRDEQARSLLDACLERLQGTPGQPATFDPLHTLLEAQPYRLAFWRVASERANYRRFFDISDLVAVRIEDPAVVDATHALIFHLVDVGHVQGLRIDHVDGLRDPGGYLDHLRRRLQRPGEPPPYVVVEKILGPGEDLPRSWPVAGTTGYDFLNALTAVFIDPDGLERLGASYDRFTGSYASFHEVARREKRRVIHDLFAGEMQSLGRRLEAIAMDDRHARDLSPEQLQAALIAVTACLPVYRTYVTADGPTPHDERWVEAAIAEAEQHQADLPAPVYAFLRRVLLLEYPPSLSDDQRRAWCEFVAQWQQVSGPVMAKGIEDTTFYVYNRLIALNEVGGHPDTSGDPVGAFHAFNARRQAAWPDSLNATSTHDTKRGADVRARLVALSEIPGEWERAVGRWSRWNQPCKAVLAGRPVPDANEEWFIYQTLAGSWPLDDHNLSTFRERLDTYLTKAMREAKVATSWLRPDPDHEATVLRFVADILTPGDENRFLPDFTRFARRIAAYGVTTGLSQALLHATAPGVPDIYRGAEVWDLTLADPDNRRPVDFDQLPQLLDNALGNPDAASERLAADHLRNWQDGRVKLLVLARALALRKAEPDLFAMGDYEPLVPRGPRAAHLVAFARHHGDRWVVTVAPRLVATLRSTPGPPLGRRAWGDTALALPPGAPARWRDALTGLRVRVDTSAEGPELPLARTLRHLPVALLVGTGPT